MKPDRPSNIPLFLSLLGSTFGFLGVVTLVVSRNVLYVQLAFEAFCLFTLVAIFLALWEKFMSRTP